MIHVFDAAEAFVLFASLATPGVTYHIVERKIDPHKGPMVKIIAISGKDVEPCPDCGEIHDLVDPHSSLFNPPLPPPSSVFQRPSGATLKPALN